VARELLSHAETIVLDASLGSVSIGQEIEMIQTMGLSGKTILLSSGEGRLREKRGLPPQLAQEAQTILYTKGWFRAVPRLLLGLPASIIAGFFVSMFLAFLLGFPLSIVRLLRLFELEFFWARFFSPNTIYLLLALVASWVYGTLFFRRAVDKASVAQLSRRLREGGLASR
jgi:hypothetical protein